MERTFEGLVYEWSQEISNDNSQKKLRGITLSDIKKLKRHLKNIPINYIQGFKECQKMCKDIIKKCNLPDGSIDVTSDFILNEIDALYTEGEKDGK